MKPTEFLEAAMALSSRYLFRTTSGFRSSRSNTNVGGVKFSAHLYWLALDVVLESGQNKTDFTESARRMGLLVIDEGDHLHLQPLDWSASVPARSIPLGRRRGQLAATGCLL